jgi:hypothetical protein
VVVRARLLGVDEVVAPSGNASSQRPTLRVRVIEVVKGPVSRGEQLRSAQHGHGVPHYRVGQEALLFLRALSRSPELGRLADEATLRWYSNQEHDDDWSLSPRSSKQTVAVARRYAAIEDMPSARRQDAMHELTARLLASRDARLARSALRDLVAMPEAPLLTQSDAPRLLEAVHDARRPIDLRVGLLAELERRGLVNGDTHWARLLRTTRGADRLAVIPAAGLHPGPAGRAALVELVSGPDVPTAASAAVALGAPGNNAAVAPLSEALRSDDPRLAMAAVRALGRVGTPPARAAIREAASSHPNATVRRRAEAELRLMAPRE